MDRVKQLTDEFPGVAWGYVYKMARKMASNSDEAEDMMQEATIAILRSYPDSPGSYYVRSAKNAMLDMRRRDRLIASGYNLDDGHRSAPSHEIMVIAAVIAEGYTDLEKAVVKVDADANSGAGLDGYTIRDYASEAGIGYSAAKGRIWKSRKKTEKSRDPGPGTGV